MLISNADDADGTDKIISGDLRALDREPICVICVPLFEFSDEFPLALSIYTIILFQAK